MEKSKGRQAWSIDAEASLQAALDSTGCPEILRRALTGVLSWQARNETSVRRALSSPRIAPQWLAALYALGATVTVQGAGGSVEMPLAEASASGVQALHVGAEGLRWGEARVARTPADPPIVAAVAGVRLENGVVQQARVALNGAWPEAVRLAQAADKLAGGPLDAPRIQAVADTIEKEVKPKGDYLGSAEYRRAMAGVLTRRALEACLQQEVGDES